MKRRDLIKNISILGIFYGILQSRSVIKDDNTSTLVLEILIPKGKTPRDYEVERKKWIDTSIVDKHIKGLFDKSELLSQKSDWNSLTRNLRMSYVFDSHESLQKYVLFATHFSKVRREVRSELGYHVKYKIA